MSKSFYHKNNSIVSPNEKREMVCFGGKKKVLLNRFSYVILCTNMI